jgi:hypothetical protein
MTVRVYRMCSEHSAIVRTLRNQLVSSTGHSMSSELIHNPLILPRGCASELPSFPVNRVVLQQSGDHTWWIMVPDEPNIRLLPCPLRPSTRTWIAVPLLLYKSTASECPVARYVDARSLRLFAQSK